MTWRRFAVGQIEEYCRASEISGLSRGCDVYPRGQGRKWWQFWRRSYSYLVHPPPICFRSYLARRQKQLLCHGTRNQSRFPSAMKGARRCATGSREYPRGATMQQAKTSFANLRSLANTTLSTRNGTRQSLPSRKPSVFARPRIPITRKIWAISSAAGNWPIASTKWEDNLMPNNITS